MAKERLTEILNKHQLWVNGFKGGEKATLSGADLREVNFRWASLRMADFLYASLCKADFRDAFLSRADFRGADCREADFRWADLSGADLRGADLRGSELRGADLYEADLRDANIDYSCLSLCQKSLTAHFDDKQLRQIAYHLVKAGLQSKNASEKTKEELKKLVDFANGFHRVDECGMIEVDE